MCPGQKLTPPIFMWFGFSVIPVWTSSDNGGSYLQQRAVGAWNFSWLKNFAWKGGQDGGELNVVDEHLDPPPSFMCRKKLSWNSVRPRSSKTKRLEWVKKSRQSGFDWLGTEERCWLLVVCYSPVLRKSERNIFLMKPKKVWFDSTQLSATLVPSHAWNWKAWLR